MEATTFGGFILASVLLTLAPGPDILYLITKSLSDGARSGIVLACGLVSGIAFHTTLVMIGVAALISSSPTALAVLKFAGALYLIFLANRALRSKQQLKLGRADSMRSSKELYLRGVLMNVLNPKVLMFFLAFLPQFVSLESSMPTSLQILLLGLTFALQALIVFSIVSFCADRLRKVIVRKKNAGVILAQAEGCVLLLIALALALS